MSFSRSITRLLLPNKTEQTQGILQLYYEKVITNSFNGIVVADNKGNIIYTTNAAQELFGLLVRL